MTTSYTLTGNVRDLIGETSKSALAYLSSNLGDVALVDLDANEVRLSGTKRIPLAADGTFSLSLIATNSTGTNISGGTLRYRVTVAYKDAAGQLRSWDSGLFAHTAAQDLSDVVASSVPPVLANEYIPTSLVDAKGDLLVGTAADTVARLPVGANGRQMFADSSQATGLRWGGAGETVGSGDVLSGGDLNVATTPGVYLANGAAANAPVAVTGFLLVRRQGSTGTNIQQEFTSQSTVPRKFVRRSADGGASWAAWTEVRTDAPLAGNTIAGTGMPEGVITGPVGMKYVDTAATNGAVEWVKASGTGNTGWRVVYGDTGWRDVKADLINGWTAAVLKIRRTQAGIYYAFEGLNPSAKTNDTLFTLPTGFTHGYNPWPAFTVGTTAVRRLSVSSTALIMNSASSADAVFYAHIFIAAPTGAASAWPSVLPGTAA